MTDDPADRMRERSQRSTLSLYLLLDADRRVLAAAIVAGVFLALVLASMLVPDAAAALRSGDPVETSFQALVGATITGVTLVLTLNQLVLSQELGTVGDQRERMDGAMAFREDVRDLLGEHPPAEPSAFLRAMVGEIADRAEGVGTGTDDEALSRLVESTVGNADRVTDRLEGATFGGFDVVRAALDFNYSWKLYEAERLRETADGERAASLADLADALRLYGPTREHFKTLYFQSELIDLSRSVLYAALPSLVVTLGVLLFVDPGRVSGVTLGVANVVWVVAAGSAVAIAPFAVLLAYVLRVATVTGRTLSIGPFILRTTDRETDA